jgi:hypothetical protein
LIAARECKANLRGIDPKETNGNVSNRAKMDRVTVVDLLQNAADPIAVGSQSENTVRKSLLSLINSHCHCLASLANLQTEVGFFSSG